jgi:hypothetical protein
MCSSCPLILKVDTGYISDSPQCPLRANTARFLEEIAEENIPFAQLGLPFDMNEALGYLKELYGE